MSAAARAASVAPDTAMPQSAFLSAGASLTPSPVIPTMWPRFCSTSMMWYLCSGKTWAKPSAVSMDSATAADSFFFASPKAAASRMLVPKPTLAAVSFAMANASPVTILTETPIAAAVVMVVAASSRGGSNSGSTPTNSPVAVTVTAGHAQRPETAGGEIVDCLIGGGFDLRGVAGQCQDDLRGALGDPEDGPVGAGDGGLGAFVHRVEGFEVGDGVSLQDLGVREAAEHRAVDGVVIVGAGGQRAGENDIGGGGSCRC